MGVQVQIAVVNSRWIYDRQRLIRTTTQTSQGHETSVRCLCHNNSIPLCSCALFSAGMPSTCVLILVLLCHFIIAILLVDRLRKAMKPCKRHALDLSHAIRYRLAMLGSLCRDVNPSAHARKTVNFW